MSREIKFRAWDVKGGFYRSDEGMEWWIYPDGRICHNGTPLKDGELILEQYTGLKDRNGREIYEADHINKTHTVIYQAPKYVLRNISNGDIIEFYEQDKREVTGNDHEVSEDPERGFDK